MDWKTSGRVKIERAKKHILDLEAEIAAFLKTHPYDVVAEVDKKGGERNHRARIYAPPPPHFAAIAGDAIHNLRCALNTLWKCAIGGDGIDRALSLGGGNGLLSADFEIYDSPTPLANRLKGVSPKGKHKANIRAVLDCYKAVKPYKGGNDLLWWIHRADIEDKHGGAAPVFVQVGETLWEGPPPGILTGGLVQGIASGVTYDGSRYRHKLTDDWFAPVHDGDIVLTEFLSFGEFDYNMQIVFVIAFGESQVIQGKPILDTLQKFVGVVEGVAETFATAGLIHG